MAFQSLHQLSRILTYKCMTINKGRNQSLIKHIISYSSSTPIPDTQATTEEPKELVSQKSPYHPKHTPPDTSEQTLPSIDYSYFRNIVSQAAKAPDHIRWEPEEVSTKELLPERQAEPRDLTESEGNSLPDLSHRRQDLTESKGDSLPDLSHIKPKLPATSDYFAAYVNESETLQKLLKLGVDLSKVEKNKEAANLILKSSFEEDLQPHLVFVKRLGVPDDKLSHVITKFPGLFLETFENLEARVNYFTSKRFSPEAIGMILTKLPEILGVATKDLDTQLGFLQKEFKLTGAEVREAITRVPKLAVTHRWIIHESVHTMTNFLGFTLIECKKMLLASPRVFLTGRDGLETRFDYLHNTIGISHKLIQAWPNVLRTRKIIFEPRYKFLQSLGRDQFDPTKDNYVSLKALATGKDRDFCHFVAKVPVEDYNKFLKTL